MAPTVTDVFPSIASCPFKFTVCVVVIIIINHVSSVIAHSSSSSSSRTQRSKRIENQIVNSSGWIDLYPTHSFASLFRRTFETLTPQTGKSCKEILGVFTRFHHASSPPPLDAVVVVGLGGLVTLPGSSSLAIFLGFESKLRLNRRSSFVAFLYDCAFVFVFVFVVSDACGDARARVGVTTGRDVAFQSN
jgi:hypothetical protein